MAQDRLDCFVIDTSLVQSGAEAAPESMPAEPCAVDVNRDVATRNVVQVQRAAPLSTEHPAAFALYLQRRLVRRQHLAQHRYDVHAAFTGLSLWCADYVVNDLARHFNVLAVVILPLQTPQLRPRQACERRQCADGP